MFRQDTSYFITEEQIYDELMLFRYCRFVLWDIWIRVSSEPSTDLKIYESLNMGQG